LTFEDGKPVIDDHYRYPENDSFRIQKAIDIKKQEIKDLEEKQKLQKPTSYKKEPFDEKTEELAIGSPSLVVSPMSLIN